jgi:BirA family biotin operon repressor/biotin-[acetyl-CoA-carboxylase] ligase
MLCLHLAHADSTNARAARLAALNRGRALLVTARTQSAGRGREGRPWHSPPGGAWFTVALPVAPGTGPETYDPMPLLAGYAVLRALRHLLGTSRAGLAATLTLKWPNDVLLNGGKVAGILCERVLPALIPKRIPKRGHSAFPDGSVARAEEAPAPVLLVGVGVNVNVDPAALGPDLRYPAASLQQAAERKISVAQVATCCTARILLARQELERRGLTEPRLRLIEAHLAWLGQTITFEHQGQSLTGRCLGLDPRGHLRVAVGGAERVFAIGEICRLAPLDAGSPAQRPGVLQPEAAR